MSASAATNSVLKGPVVVLQRLSSKHLKPGGMRLAQSRSGSWQCCLMQDCLPISRRLGEPRSGAVLAAGNAAAGAAKSPTQTLRHPWVADPAAG